MKTPRTEQPIVLLLLAMLGACALLPSRIAAQHVVVVSRSESCRRCAVELMPFASIGASTDPLLIKRVPSVGVDSRGLIYVGPTFGPSQIAVFDSTGTVRFGFGRNGRGPGEISAVHRIQVGQGDSIVVFDLATGRVSVFGPSREYVESEPVSHLSRDGAFIRLESGDIVGSDATGAVSAVSGSRGLVVEFEPGGQASSDRYGRLRTLSSATSDSSVWIGRRNAYRVELWTTRGALETVLTRRVAWFPEWTVLPKGAPTRARPTPDLIGVWHETPDRLWTFSRVASAGWKPGRKESGWGWATTIGSWIRSWM